MLSTPLQLASMSNNIEDDFFGDCDDNDALIERFNDAAIPGADQYGELSNRESAATERQHFAIGYHETYDDSYEASLQNGFDDGYCSNYDTALHLGQILGQFAIRVESSKKFRENDGSYGPRHATTENKLTEISHRIRNLLLSITQSENSQSTKKSKGDGFQKEYDGVMAEVVESSTKASQEQRLKDRKDLEDLTEDVKNIITAAMAE